MPTIRHEISIINSSGTGTLGTNCVGTEAALATSTAVDASTMFMDR